MAAKRNIKYLFLVYITGTADQHVPVQDGDEERTFAGSGLRRCGW